MRTGYVVLVTGVTLVHMGNNVTCVDVDENKIRLMRKGICPIYEKDLEELMLKNKNRLNYTTDYKTAYKDADVIFIGGGTLDRVDESASPGYVYSVVGQIANSLEKDCVVVVKSTVPIGTNDEIEKYLKELVKPKLNVYIASNPEFLAQGTAVRDTLYASRIVVGIEDEAAKKIMEEVYEPLTKEPYNVPYISMNRKSAEMVKYASVEERIKRIRNRNISDDDLKKKRLYIDGYDKYFEAIKKYNMPYLLINNEKLSLEETSSLVLYLLELVIMKKENLSILSELFSIESLSLNNQHSFQKITELISNMINSNVSNSKTKVLRKGSDNNETNNY